MRPRRRYDKWHRRISLTCGWIIPGLGVHVESKRYVGLIPTSRYRRWRVKPLSTYCSYSDWQARALSTYITQGILRGVTRMGVYDTRKARAQPITRLQGTRYPTMARDCHAMTHPIVADSRVLAGAVQPLEFPDIVGQQSRRVTERSSRSMEQIYKRMGNTALVE